MGATIIEGDCILDCQGAIGIVLSTYGKAIAYKTVAHDGMEFLHDGTETQVTTLSKDFKRKYLGEIRKLKRRNYAESERIY